MPKKRNYVWARMPQKNAKDELPDAVKLDLEAKAAAWVEELKRQFVKPPPTSNTFNYIVDINTKWLRGNLYFYSTYCCPGPDAIAPSFETNFARLKHVGGGRFDMAYMRHTNQWDEVGFDMTVDECMEFIKNPFFDP